MKILVTLAFSLCLAWAQTGVTTPQLGFVTDAGRSLRPLLGVSGSLVMGDPVGEGVVSTASSGHFTLVKTDSQLTVMDQSGQPLWSMPCDPGNALLGFAGDGSPGLVWVVETSTLYVWRLDHMEILPVDGALLGGKMVAVGSTALLVRRDDGLWKIDLSPADGEVTGVAALPGIQGGAVLQGDGSLIYVDGPAVVVRGAAGAETRVPIDAEVGWLHPLAGGWVAAGAKEGAGRFAIRYSPLPIRVSQIPEEQ